MALLILMLSDANVRWLNTKIEVLILQELEFVTSCFSGCMNKLELEHISPMDVLYL